MAKIPKPPKGGRSKVESQPPGQKITVDQMLAERHMYQDKMYKPGQVKTPADIVVNPAFLSQLEALKVFSDLKIVAPVFDKYDTTYGGHKNYEECMELSHNNNLMILLEALSDATTFSDMSDPYDRGFINLLKSLVALYEGNPYTRDRIGWFMWEIGKHIYPNCYFPMTMDMYYDPRLWHRPGENYKGYLPIPPTVAIDGSSQIFGPEDDIWNCELPDPGSGE